MIKLIGILNLHTQSFSGDGTANIDATIERIIQMAECGVSIVDVGAEPTNPHASNTNPPSKEMELQILAKTLPIIIDACTVQNLEVSLDTRHHEVAQVAIKAGVHIINDVSGVSGDMIKVLQDSNVKVIAMHSLSLPPSRNITIEGDPINHLLKWSKNKITELTQQNIARHRISIDPGIGFGTTAKQAWSILSNLETFNELEVPLCIGHSRKSFFNDVTNIPFSERDIETTATSLYLSSLNMTHDLYLRVHNVAMHSRALKVWDKLATIHKETV